MKWHREMFTHVLEGPDDMTGHVKVRTNCTNARPCVDSYIYTALEFHFSLPRVQPGPACPPETIFDARDHDLQILRTVGSSWQNAQTIEAGQVGPAAAKKVALRPCK